MKTFKVYLQIFALVAGIFTIAIIMTPVVFAPMVGVSTPDHKQEIVSEVESTNLVNGHIGLVK